MALTRKFLAALGIEADKVDEIIEAHTETVNALKEERNQYKADAEKLATVQAELDQYKNGEDYQKKYNDEHKAFEDYKKGVEKEKTANQIKALYKKLLADSKIDEKRIDAIMKVTDFSNLKLKDGKLDDEETLAKSIKEEWAGFIVEDKTKGAAASNPPEGTGAGKEQSGRSGRAAELAKKYNESRYGITKKE